MHLIRWPACAALLICVAACGAGDAPQTAPTETDAAEEEAARDYEVLLGNAISDTLQGDARFGRVIDTDTSQETFVIELETGFDFAGGFFIAHGGPELPTTGTHELVAPSDSLGGIPPGRYAIVYRQGMLRDLASRAGTVTFSTVTDTLIEGSFDATLRGFLALDARRLPNAEVHARGSFRARPGSPGYIIGL